MYAADNLSCLTEPGLQVIGAPSYIEVIFSFLSQWYAPLPSSPAPAIPI